MSAESAAFSSPRRPVTLRWDCPHCGLPVQVVDGVVSEHTQWRVRAGSRPGEGEAYDSGERCDGSKQTLRPGVAS